MIACVSQSFAFVAEDADICGVDEAGRGPLAGPVVAAAMVLDPMQPIEGLRDSKLLTELQRVRLAHYGFDGNKGYATATHLRALAAFGPCAIRRASFAPVRDRGGGHDR